MVSVTEPGVIWDTVDDERPIAIIHANSTQSAEKASAKVREACTVAADPPASRPVICETLAAD